MCYMTSGAYIHADAMHDRMDTNILYQTSMVGKAEGAKI